MQGQGFLLRERVLRVRSWTSRRTHQHNLRNLTLTSLLSLCALLLLVACLPA